MYFRYSKITTNTYGLCLELVYKLLLMIRVDSQSAAPGEIKLGASSCTSGVRRRDLMSEITSSRRRCKTLESLQDEYLLVAYMEVYLSQGLVRLYMYY